MRKFLLALSIAACTLAAIISALPVLSGSAPASAPGMTSTVLQMNLCLSGQADCYSGTHYPSVVEEATAQIMEQTPSFVTLNEACSADVDTIARRTGYWLRFAAVHVDGAPLPCVEPGGRGIFGLAVLTADAISSSRGRAFASQAGSEERRWLCARTVREVTACTAHLSTRGTTQQRVANDAQCMELRGLLDRRAQSGATVFGGDVNRQESCAPSTMLSDQDDAATQHAGIQHIYGSMPGGGSVVRVTASTYSDHDFLFAGGTLPPYVGRAAGPQ